MSAENKSILLNLAQNYGVPIYITQANVPYHIDIIPYED